MNDIPKYNKIPPPLKIFHLNYKPLFIVVVILVLICIYNNIISYQKLKLSENKLSRPVSVTVNDGVEDKYIHKNLKCYSHSYFKDSSELSEIDDILSNKYKPKKGKSIFFHETTCSRTSKMTLSARKACAIESAALLNPNFDIFVLFASPVNRPHKNQSEINFNIEGALRQYKNIYFRTVNIWRYAEDTPISNWFDEGHLFFSHFIEEHISNFLRFLTLWRWGGTHLDLDIILKKTLENIPPNFVGAVNSDVIGNAVINLNVDSLGHLTADMLLDHCKMNFNPYLSDSIGSRLITKVIRKICITPVTELMTLDRCGDFQVFDKNAFYAINKKNLKEFYHEIFLNKSLQLTKNSIAIHLWNKHSRNYAVKVGSKVAYAYYAEKYCPKVYSSCGEYF